MRPIAGLALLALLGGAAYPVPPREERGRKDADCRPQEPGPAIRVEVDGLKDAEGTLRLELYPANDDDFLAADKVLIAAGKPFQRVVAAPPHASHASLCIRAPAPGTYALMLLHDRDNNGKFSLFSDGVGFSRNPVLHTGRPKAAEAAIGVPPHVIAIRIVMNYRQGFHFAPLAGREGEAP